MELTKIKKGKSRRDDPEFNSGLLTVGFNLRTENATQSSSSPAGTTQLRDDMPSLRDLGSRSFFPLRRLKPTVNNPELNSGSSLRDFSPLTQYCYSTFLNILILDKKIIEL